MKIIDLLKLVAKKKKMPEKIKYYGLIYEWVGILQDYQCEDHFLFMDLFNKCDYNLNDLVEVI